MRTINTDGGSTNNKIGVFTNDLNNENSVKIREYINPAVYVETSYDMAMGKKDSICLNMHGSGDHPKIVKVKRCLCFTNPKECPCHPYVEEYDEENPIENYVTKKISRSQSSTSLLPKSAKYTPNKSTSNFDSDSGITVKATISTSDDLHLSITSLTTLNTVRCIDEQTKEENFRNWLIKKDEEKKALEKRETMLIELKRLQREKHLEEERENFKRWLANKKKLDDQKKKELEEKEKEEHIRMEYQEQKDAKSKKQFQLWLQKKVEMDLEKKNKEQTSLVKQEEERQKRKEYSQKSYEIWLQQSKDKPRPIPLNRGLESLKSSVSVTYINPQPWVPNIDIKEKPASQ